MFSQGIWSLLKSFFGLTQPRSFTTQGAVLFKWRYKGDTGETPPKWSMGMVYLPTFTMNLSQMQAPMGCFGGLTFKNRVIWVPGAYTCGSTLWWGKYTNPIGSYMALYMPAKTPQGSLGGRIHKALIFSGSICTVNTWFPEKNGLSVGRGWCPLIPIMVRPYYHRIHVWKPQKIKNQPFLDW